ncbi:short-chain dehydrogenase TIC 32 B, chloroplastic-like [Zingiber officinale]|uniref:short-chain dehydrogenase TIC 32 B, chloroplastic-like n=1 Tax=Zingiber officinale TaxID=94328 RepID=UPI001C4B9E5E|nr:short-chain dehydrogenase TIC 32 B, chloroplastic-like [Zingiber officinale]
MSCSCPYALTEDGIEKKFVTNHLRDFLLTNLLLDKMKRIVKWAGVKGRIMNVSSLAHVNTYMEGIHFDKINDKDSYNDKLAYGQSKMVNVLHANELARCLKNVPLEVITTSYVVLHPNLKGVTKKYFNYFHEEDTSAHAKDEELVRKLWDLELQQYVQIVGGHHSEI